MPGPSNVGGFSLPGLLSIVIVLMVVFLPMLLHRGGRPPGDSEPGPQDGWGNGPGPPPPPAAPRGGIPLDAAEPAHVRLRDHGRLADGLGARERRPAREPAREPAHEPARDPGASPARS
ncbi:MAG: hypothetical protein ACJ780_10900 [Solirubrobacteraceae bacterium]